MPKVLRTMARNSKAKKRESSVKKEKVKVAKWKELRQQSFKDMLVRANLCWSKLKVGQDSGVILNFEYPLTSKFFLNSARDDMKDGSARGLINALSNAKRAIDCQTDSFLSSIGYSPKNLDKQLGRTVMEGLRTFTSNTEQPLKFRVLESLGIVTPAIVTRVRVIRNLLEHQYKKPSKNSVRDAIDIASLYVSACRGAMSVFLESISLEVGEIQHPLDGDMVAERSVRIELHEDEPIHIELRYRDFAKRERAETRIWPTDPCYLALLRILFAVRAGENLEQAITFAAKSAGMNMDGIKVKVESVSWS